MPAPDSERHDEYLARYLRTGEAQDHRHRPRGDGPAQGRIGRCRCPCRSANSRLEGGRYFTGIVRDITERKRAEERQRLLTAEVDHRAKNLLATIQAMVVLTKRDARSVDDYRRHPGRPAARDGARARPAGPGQMDGRLAARRHPERVRRPMPAPTAPGLSSSARTRCCAPRAAQTLEPRAARADHQRRQIWRALGARRAASRSAPIGRRPGRSSGSPGRKSGGPEVPPPAGTASAA